MMRCRPFGLFLILAASRAAAAEGTFEARTEDGRYYLRAESLIDAPVDSVYAVLTDFDALSRLDKTILASRVVERHSDTVNTVYTRVKGCVGFVFCRTLHRVERVEERPPFEIHAELLPERSDFNSGAVHWQLEEAGTRTRLRNTVEIEPGFWTPRAMTRRMMIRATERTYQNLEQLAREHAAEHASLAGH